MLSMLSPPVSEWPGVTAMSLDDETAGLAALKRVLRAVASPVSISVAEKTYTVQRSIGAGAYATVYQAIEGSTGADVALKVEAPPCPWEWYMCKVVAGRMPEERKSAVLDPSNLVLGPGASVVEMPRGCHGSLQDLLNRYLALGERPDEVIVARLATSLLRMLGDLHALQVLHNDIKPDNLLVTLVDGCRSSHGVETGPIENRTVGLQLIDFGRSVDLALLPPGSVMAGDCGTEAFRCVEMREGRPWLWQADAYGAAGVIHCLLFGEYMDVERVMTDNGETFLRIKSAFRRYWQREMWNDVFSKLLNWTTLDAGASPPWTELADELDVYLDSREAQRKEETEMHKLMNMLV
jgi:checkpoint serine/threonine-protein kinase